MDLPFIDANGNLDLAAFQYDVGQWAERNFGEVQPIQPLLGMVEELGELCHAILKHQQGIRGFEDEATVRVAIEDAVGDLMVYAANFMNRHGLSLERAIVETWTTVRQRDWTKNPVTGAADN